jgi:hypothetical protein
MTYSVNDTLGVKKGALLYDGTSNAVKVTGTNLSSVIGVDGTSYPAFVSTTTSLSVFKTGQYVTVSGFAAGNAVNNGTYLVTGYDAPTKTLSVTGKNGIITATAGDSVTIRQAFIVKVGNLRSVQGAAHPLTIVASTSSALSAAQLQVSLDAGVTWQNVPNAILPDTNNGSALVINVILGFESLLRMSNMGSFAGEIRVG